jgi:DNA-binding SARP family transcriptional activator
VEIRLLGPVQAWRDGVRVGLGPRKQRFVLAVLALDVNRLVPLDRLVDLSWPSCPPRSARQAIRVSVSRLRAAIAPAELVGEAGGYVLHADPMLVDAHRFRALVGEARRSARDAERVALFRQALDLWCGPALADAAAPEVVNRLTSGLAESRLTATEECLEAELRLGRPLAVLDELVDLVARYPYRERLVALLMTAQYRADRPADALATLRTARTLLAHDLGLAPGERLARLEEAILRSDPALDLRVADDVRIAPAQLPADVTGFAGRADQLAELSRILPGSSSAPVTVAITGTAGVGKTALAVRWAHRVADCFPDGQLYADLSGREPAVAVLSRLLRSLGASDIPDDLDLASATYRSLLSGKRVLILLDDAASEEQVRPLLPGSAGCLTVVTSRCRLAGLVAANGASRITVGVLPTADAADLIASLVGSRRAAAEPRAIAELARLCAHLPLALRVAAADIAHRTHDTIAQYVTRLRQTNLLAALRIRTDPEVGVEASIDRSYWALSPGTRQLFGLLGMARDAEITAETAAGLSGLALEQASAGLARLADVHLIDEVRPGRFAFHDLLRLYAARRAGAE